VKVDKTALTLLEEVAETLTDFVIDETIPQEHRDRVAPSVGAIDEFLADSLLESEDTDYDEDEYDEDEYDEDDDTYADDEDLDLLPDSEDSEDEYEAVA
jgi:hypothetical protein